MSSRSWVIVKREFTEAVRTRMFLIMTLLAPLFMIAIFAMPVVLAGDGGGQRSIAVVDATDAGIGADVVALLSASGAGADGAADRRFAHTELVPIRGGGLDIDSLRAALTARIRADELDGFLWLPAGLLAGERAAYDGENATNIADVGAIRSALQTAVREHRLRAAGIEPAQVAAAMRPVGFDLTKTGENTTTGSAGSTMAVALGLGILTYMVVLLYGQAVMRGVLEEKRDRIVEILASSIRTSQLMMGKVLGIGATGLLQVGIWLGLAVIGLTQGDVIAARFGAEMPELPQVPVQVWLIFVLYFLGGYFLYAALFAVAGAIVTSDQEAQQVAFPIMLPIIAGFFLMFSGIENPEGGAMRAGSIVPFTSPIVMPTRMSLVEVPTAELVGSLVLLAATAVACVWIAAKIYRIGMLATGAKPSLRELVRWVRAA